MALSRGRRFEPNVWPGFVDVMTALVMVIMFVLTIVFVVQAVMRDQLDSQGAEISTLGETARVLESALTRAEGDKSALGAQLGSAQRGLASRGREIDRLSEVLGLKDAALGQAEAAAAAKGAEAERLALAERTARAQAEAALARAAGAEGAVAAARSEVDKAAAEARLAAARADALEALVADLRRQGSGAGTALAEAQQRLTEAEAARMAEAAAAEALRAKLASSEAELTAMGLALEESRKRAGETLTLLAAAEAARAQSDRKAETQISEADKQAALLKIANDKLSRAEALSADGLRKVALLNAQVADLTARIGALQEVLDARDAAAGGTQARLDDLGARLNEALLAKAAAEKDRATAEAARASAEAARAAEADRLAALEADKRARAEAEAQDLTAYRSEFFGRLSGILAGREGVRVVGDRFVFPSDVSFAPASANLTPEGQAQLDSIAVQLKDIAKEIPPFIDWVLRVDGHTDATPLAGTGRYRDNWELSQARALAVVRYLVEVQGFPPERLVAAGFGQYRPAVPGDTAEARAANRRIELKLTER